MVSVIIVNYNTGVPLRNALEALKGTAECEVIVVDNQSIDDVTPLVRTEFPWVRWIQLDKNVGYGAANNIGAKSATGDVLLLLNPDAAIAGDDLARVRELCLEDSSVGAIGFRQVDSAGEWQLSIGLEPSFLSEAARKLVQDRLDGGDVFLARFLDARLSKPREVAWVAGSALALRRESFERVGGFDERFFLYFEDIDLCLRLSREVGRVVYNPTITLSHIRGAAAETAPTASQRYYRQSQVTFWSIHGRGRMGGAWMKRYAEYRLKRSATS